MANHDKFLERLSNSRHAIWLVAYQLWLNGWTVVIPTTKKAPSPDLWKQYADQGDLFVTKQVLLNVIDYKIEIKHINTQFHDAKSWPHRYYYVCAKHSFDAAQRKADFYINISEDYLRAGIVEVANTKQSWDITTTRDKGYKNTQEVYYCPLYLVKFTNVGGMNLWIQFNTK